MSECAQLPTAVPPSDREAYLRFVVSRLPGFIWTTGTDLRLTMRVGRGCEPIDSAAERAALGRHIGDFFGTRADDFPPIAAHLRALTGAVASYEQEWESRCYRALVEPLRDANDAIVGVIGVALDVTEHNRVEEALQAANTELEVRVAERTATLQQLAARLQTELSERAEVEAALRASEERFALAVAGANDGIWDWDIAADTVYLSPRWKHILGYAEGEVGSGMDEWRRLVHPDDLPQLTHQVTEQLQSPGIHHHDSEHRLRHKDGSYRWVQSRGLLLRDARGRPRRVVGSLTDISDRKQAEEDMQRRQAELAHAQRVSTLGELAAGLTHELNQPLTAIVNYARGCVHRLRAGAADPQELIDAIEQIAAQALRGAEIIRRHRRFARPDTRSAEQIDVNGIVEDVVRLMHGEARAEGVAIGVELADSLPAVCGDTVQIEQVVLNLVRNAVEAMRGCEPGELWIRTAVDSSEIRVSVEDSGLGLPPGMGDRIFDAFVTTKPDGLGMGLSVSRTIIAAHGGHLWATSNRGRGMTFWFTLPFAGNFVAGGPRLPRHS